MIDSRSIVTLMAKMHAWQPTVQQVRECVLNKQIAGMATGNDHPSRVTQSEVSNIGNFSRAAIRAGRMLDFGFLPNEVIRDCGKRGGALYNLGALHVPFADPWLYMHSWSAGPEQKAVSVYLVNQVDGDLELLCFEPMVMDGVPRLTIGDRALLFAPTGEAELSEDGYPKYSARIIPAPWRLVEDDLLQVNGRQTPQQAAAGNVLDPLVTVLLILQTRGVQRETIDAPERLQRARVKSGKLPIPSYDRVHVESYVTALSASLSHKANGDGKHASPRWHLRRGTVRNYQSGARSIIMDTLVNVDPEVRAAFKTGKLSLVSDRVNYEVKP
jgi:hypothetical protein